MIASLLLILPLVAGGVLHQGVRAANLWPGLRRSLDDLWFGGREVFGANKTIRGFVVVPLGCGAFFALEKALLLQASSSSVASALPWLAGFALGLAYVLGELPNSYLKRRLGIAPGSRSERFGWAFFLLDQLDSAIACAAAFVLLGAPLAVVLPGLLIAPVVHAAVNAAAHLARLRSSPW